ncbi:MAG: succinyl-diaminopimelate desuccinylase [Dongiaceae bacterium]
MAGSAIDPVALASDLIRCPSVTPKEAGALGILEQALEPLGFRCRRMPFESEGSPRVDNLFAVHGSANGRHLCFAGHTDVVPPGAVADWRQDPFRPTIADGQLWGRGAADMKGAIACFAAAASRFLLRQNDTFVGRISFLITGDEEGPSVNGTRRMLETLAAEGERFDACVVGEPTNPERIGEMIKIGRRGSLTGYLTVHGVQGHSAYPHRADNPVHRLLRMLGRAIETPLDRGSDHFEASTFQISTVDVGNPASNVIPAAAHATFNIRFNDRHTRAGLEQLLRTLFDEEGARYEIRFAGHGDAFLTPPGEFSAMLTDAVRTVTGIEPQLSTTGGTSDARFIKDYCPVAEFGMTGQTMHQVDERVPLADLAALTQIYEALLNRFFADSAPGAPPQRC